MAGDPPTSPVNKKQLSESHFETASSDAKSDIDFGGDTALPPPPKLTAEEEKKLWRKIDLRLMPILSCMYLASFIDRGKLSFA
jgi:hypothetical protein